MFKRIIVVVLVLAGYIAAQRRVDPRYTYYRVVGIVPLVGKGTPADPKRPEYAPWPAAQDPNGIIGCYSEPTDDGKSVVAEFVARNRSALLPILNDKTIKVFEKGRASKSAQEAAIKPLRKDFSLDTFGMVM